MATQPRTSTRHGWVRCPACDRQFLREHRCTKPIGEVVDRRPPGFEDQVAQARAEARAEQAAGEQLALTDLPDPCRTCRRGDVTLGAGGDCVSCMAATALAAADLPYIGPAEPSRAPP